MYCLRDDKRLIVLILMSLCVWAPLSGAVEESEQLALEQKKTLEARVEAISDEHGVFSMALYEPLLTLAQFYFEQGQLEDSAEALRRAQNVAHRNEGVYTPMQLKIIERLAGLSLINDEFKEANKQKKFAFFISTHHLDEDHPDYLYAYAELADWYMNSGQPLRAKRLLEEAIDLAQERNEETLAFTLMIDKARRLQGVCCSTRHLTEIIDSRDRNPTDPDSLAYAYMTIGDAFILARKEENAEVFYQLANELTPLRGTGDPQPITIMRSLDESRQARIQAYTFDRDPLIDRRLRRMTPTEQLEDEFQDPQWFILDADDSHVGYKIRDLHETSNKDKRTQTLLGEPIKFEEEQLKNLLPFRLHPRGEMAELMIEMSFTVTETGDLTNIEVVESNAPSKLNRLLIDVVRKVYYRPALEGGTPVATDHVRLVQTFPSTLDFEWE